jgi:Glycosyltransferase
MKIFLDGNALKSEKTGIGDYTYNLVAEIAGSLGDGEELTVGIRQKLYNGAGDPEIAEVRILPTPERYIRKYIPFCPNWLKGFDIYHQPNYIPHVFTGKTITTVHDMSYRAFPQYHPRSRVFLLRAFEDRLRKADRIITDSQYSRQEIVEMLRVSQESVTVIYLGAGSQYRPIAVSSDKKLELQSRYALPERYLLYVGTIEPRKNLERLIEAFYLYRQEEIGAEVKLVLAGGKGWLYEDIFAQVKVLHLEQDVIFTGYVPDEDLLSLYNMALAFVYPSLYEGFGLPPLEAMSCGVPVISSNTSSIPEVVGDAGILIDPYRTEDIAEAIGKLASSESLRDELSWRGIQRSRLFSWKQCAIETLQVYRECMLQ